MFYGIFRNSNYTFEGKKPYENVIVLLYRHWFTLFGKLLAYTILAFLPFVISHFASRYLTNLGLDNIFSFLTAIYFLFWWTGLFYSITMYLLDIWIVTDHRLLDNEQHGLFDRTFSEMNLSRVQDVSVESKGLIPTFLNYGDLEVQTAGTEVKFIFKQIPDPVGVKAKIMQAASDFNSQHQENVEIHNGLPSL